MSIVSEFKEFAMKGSVIDLAVGVVIGAAFGKIVASLVGDVVMPALSPILGSVNFTDLAVRISSDAAGKPVLHHRAVHLHRDQGHQPPEAPKAGCRASATDQDRGFVAGYSRSAGKEVILYHR
jgi:Large-conductance mechanosensitive channel, MscL